MARRGHGYLDWAGLQLIMGGTLLVPVRHFPSPSRPIRFGDVSEANGPIFTSADLIDACARDVTAVMLEVKKKSISLLLQLYFHVNSSKKIVSY